MDILHACNRLLALSAEAVAPDTTLLHRAVLVVTQKCLPIDVDAAATLACRVRADWGLTLHQPLRQALLEALCRSPRRVGPSLVELLSSTHEDQITDALTILIVEEHKYNDALYVLEHCKTWSTTACHQILELLGRTTRLRLLAGETLDDLDILCRIAQVVEQALVQNLADDDDPDDEIDHTAHLNALDTATYKLLSRDVKDSRILSLLAEVLMLQVQEDDDDQTVIGPRGQCMFSFGPAGLWPSHGFPDVTEDLLVATDNRMQLTPDFECYLYSEEEWEGAFLVHLAMDDDSDDDDDDDDDLA